MTFPLDQALTTLVRHNAGLPMTNLVDMSFDRDDPRRRAAAAYDAGVFYRDSAGIWHDLTSYLPEPLSPVVAVGIDCEAVYAMTNGRGLMRIVGYRNA